MEYHLLNNYLKYQKDHRDSLIKTIKSTPMWMLILLILAVICLVMTVLSVYVDQLNSLFVPFATAEVVLAFSLYWTQEMWEIKYSRKLYADFRENANNLYNWLSEYAITTREDIELIKSRLANDLEKQDQLKRQQSDKFDKWMQVLVVPVILAIITAFISSQTDMEQLVGYVLHFLALVGIILAAIWIARSIYKIFINIKRNNIELFIDDLQSVIDVKFVFYSSNSIDTEDDKSLLGDVPTQNNQT